MSNLSAEIQAILTSHIATIVGEAQAILEEADRPDPSIAFLSEATHKIKGGSGTAGFMEIFRIASALNDSFKLLVRDGGGMNAEILALLDEFRAAMSIIKPQDSLLWQKYIAA